MTKKQKIITAIAIPVLLLGGFIVVKAALKSKKMTPPTPAPKKKGKIVVQETEIINEEDYFAAEEDFYPIKRGSVNDFVIEIQKALNDGGATNSCTSIGKPLTEDGKYGCNTESAVEYFLGKKTIDNKDDYQNLLEIIYAY
jgi:hypothetical protein